MAKYDVFISYSRKDTQQVNSLIARLRQEIPNIKIWYDIEGIESAEAFKHKIIDALNNTVTVIFACSDNSLASRYCEKEVSYAEKTGKKVIPYILPGSQLKDWLLFDFSEINCVHATKEDEVLRMIEDLKNWKKQNGGVEVDNLSYLIKDDEDGEENLTPSHQYEELTDSLVPSSTQTSGDSLVGQEPEESDEDSDCISENSEIQEPEGPKPSVSEPEQPILPAPAPKEISQKAEEKEADLPNHANGHEWVDLGLPSGTMWASCNVGATKPEEFGGFFAWGEVEPKDSFKNKDILTMNKSPEMLAYEKIVDQNGNLRKEYDAATQNWGEPWRMPSEDEMWELRRNTKTEWVDLNGIKGKLIISKINGNSIFIPSSGYYDGSSHNGIGTNSKIWSATPKSKKSANILYVWNNMYGIGYGDRYDGYSVRPVINPSLVSSLDKNTDASKDNSTQNNHKEKRPIEKMTGSENKNPIVNEGKTENVQSIEIISETVQSSLPTSESTVISEEVVENLSDSLNQTNGHEWVDFGLPSGLKWATSNLGASRPEESGEFFVWGEAQSKDSFTSKDIFTMNKSPEMLAFEQIVDQSGNLKREYDAATQNWGEPWRMPTLEEMQELKENIKTEWAVLNGVKGKLVISKINGKSMFLPASGYYYLSSKPSSVGTYCFLWSATSKAKSKKNSHTLFVDKSSFFTSTETRYYGLPIRPVTK